MHSKTILSLLALPALAMLLACESRAPERAREAQPAMETAPAAPATPAPQAAAPPMTPSGAASTLTVATTPQYGPHLTDSSGRALYLLDADRSGTSTCYDECATVWPPLLASQGMPTAGDAMVQSGMIRTLQRRDGSTQVTYNNHPLYYYSRDSGPGQVTGQAYTDQWGEWYLVTPAGEELK